MAMLRAMNGSATAERADREHQDDKTLSSYARTLSFTSSVTLRLVTAYVAIPLPSNYMKALVKGEGKQEGDIEEKLKCHCEQQSRCTEGYRASSPMKSPPYPYNGWDTKTNLGGVEDKRCRIEHAYLRIGHMCLGITERKAGDEREKSRRNRQMIEQEKNEWQ
jgi:hypothetical protein